MFSPELKKDISICMQAKQIETWKEVPLSQQKEV